MVFGQRCQAKSSHLHKGILKAFSQGKVIFKIFAKIAIKTFMSLYKNLNLNLFNFYCKILHIVNFSNMLVIVFYLICSFLWKWGGGGGG